MQTMINKVGRIFSNPALLYVYISKVCRMRFISDEKHLSIMYKGIFGRDLNWNQPQYFNEKLQWLKIHNRKGEYSDMVDKCAAKDYVANILGREYIIPTLGVWDRFEDIDFSKLPKEFVLKCTHDSGGLVICKDKEKLDIKKTKKKINRCLKRNFFWQGREWPYKNVKPRIIAESYLSDGSGQDIKDYKFFCFNGKCKCFKVDFDRFSSHHANYYDANGEYLDFSENICPSDPQKKIILPDNFLKMKKLAECVSKDQPFLRADFYDVNGKVYFGELTFYPASGFGHFKDDSTDKILGNWLKL